MRNDISESIRMRERSKKWRRGVDFRLRLEMDRTAGKAGQGRELNH